MNRSRALRTALLLLVIAYGTLLRFDALTLTYGTVQSPGWLRGFQESRGTTSALRPADFKWERWQGRYISDPYTYLIFAREMRSFYAAHRREPLFPLATKGSLRLLGNQDIAVSFASMFFSVLAIAFTFLLGRTAFNFWVGLGAAAALAIEFDAVSWGVGGWRDDAFMCAVVLSAWAMLRMLRDPSGRNAAIAGAVAAAACLTRITSLSFLLPSLAILVVALPLTWRSRLKPLGITSAVAMLLAGPYLVNCWQTFGDPLYAINVHADVYRTAEGQQVQGNQTADEYIRGTLLSRPWTSIDTGLQGMTTYPFTNKWTGFDPWSRKLGAALSWLALLGLVLFLRTREGRLLLIILAGSLVPYALTWKLIFDWRFTMHAYPFFLLASFYALIEMMVLLGPSRLRELAHQRPERKRLLAWTAGLAVAAGVLVVMFVIVPPRAAAETLRAGEPVSFGPYLRDRLYFDDGWSGPSRGGNVVARISTGGAARLHLPLPEVRDYVMTIRMDPSPGPAAAVTTTSSWVRVLMNDQLVGMVQLQWDPQRIGSYRVTVPASAVRSGRNRLTLSPSDRDGRAARIRFWYVRVWTVPTT
ncbi:MAG: glycosyltransferase family 39 protein [Acidobacteriota bacterium]|nr:glycosyltransferase family 39 protein [Acidobacteriota bacterium]